MLSTKKTDNRLLSLDAFRGLTIIGMILVNSPGNQSVYPWLAHSLWDGCTIADLVFPFFIFIMGAGIALSISKRLQQDVSLSELFFKILQRTAILFLLGFFLNAFGHHFHFETVRIMGVLQRIAICYFFAAILFLIMPIRMQVILLIILLVGYWLAMTLVAVPGYGTNNLTPAGQLAAYMDRLILTQQHMFMKGAYDPEGIFSTIPAIATALIGNLTGAWLLSLYRSQMKCLAMIAAGTLVAIAGWIWGLGFPINKALWTSSFVLWTGGLALCLFAVFYWLIDIKGWHRWCKPLEIFGVNAIAAYCLHIFFLEIQDMIHVTQADGSRINLRIFITGHLFGWGTPQCASLLYAASYTLFWFLVLYILYRKKIFIKI